jgi:predicted nucleic acid-binding protein
MTEKYYFDTSIWLDYYLKRASNGKIALKLILKIIDENGVIVYSDFILKEFKRLGFTTNEINSILRIAKPDHIKGIHLNKEQLSEAAKLSKQRDIPLGDCIHALLARDNELQLVSRDHHFTRLKDIADTKLPEDLI